MASEIGILSPPVVLHVALRLLHAAAPRARFRLPCAGAWRNHLRRHDHAHFGATTYRLSAPCASLSRAPRSLSRVRHGRDRFRAAARRPSYRAIIGSGTISNYDRSRGSSCIAEKRMLETIADGSPSTPFMKFGDTVQIEMLDEEGMSIFGAIRQKVVQS